MNNLDKKGKLKILFSEEEIQKKVNFISDKLNRFYKDEDVCAICVLKGSFMFASDIVKKLNMPLTIEFIKLSSYGDSTKSSGKVNAIDISLPDLNGKNILIIEDIVETGLTAKFLVDYITTTFRPKSLQFISLLNKKESRQTDFNPDYFAFDIDDKFVVGYGLDYGNLYRNLPYIGYFED